MRVNANDLRDAEQRIKNFIKKENRLPNLVTLRDMDNPANVELPIRQVCGLFFNDYTFWLKEGRHPNFVTLNIEKSEPIIQNYQDTFYTCCPTSLSMVSTKLFQPKTESECSTILGTTKNGTNPANLVANAPRLGFTVEAMARNPQNVAAALSQYKGILVHYQTGPADCSGFLNDYGHYAVIKAVGGGRYTVMDPTKGLYTCPTSVLDKATNGRALYYYRVSLR